MRKTRRIIPYALLSGLLVSCVTDHKLARVRISQPQMKEAVADTGFRLPRQITWTDDKGKEHIVTEATKDSVTGEYITQMELSEITVVAKSKQVAERNGKINLDFIVTVPGELIDCRCKHCFLCCFVKYIKIIGDGNHCINTHEYVTIDDKFVSIGFCKWS